MFPVVANVINSSCNRQTATALHYIHSFSASGGLALVATSLCAPLSKPFTALNLSSLAWFLLSSNYWRWCFLFQIKVALLPQQCLSHGLELSRSLDFSLGHPLPHKVEVPTGDNELVIPGDNELSWWCYQLSQDRTSAYVAVSYKPRD